MCVSAKPFLPPTYVIHVSMSSQTIISQTICTGPNRNGKNVSFASDNGIDVDEYPG